MISGCIQYGFVLVSDAVMTREVTRHFLPAEEVMRHVFVSDAFFPSARSPASDALPIKVDGFLQRPCRHFGQKKVGVRAVGGTKEGLPDKLHGSLTRCGFFFPI